jgi:hypothetical protein
LARRRFDETLLTNLIAEFQDPIGSDVGADTLDVRSPRTLSLAEDAKINDPTIVGQIRPR